MLVVPLYAVARHRHCGVPRAMSTESGSFVVAEPAVQHPAGPAIEVDPVAAVVGDHGVANVPAPAMDHAHSVAGEVHDLAGINAMRILLGIGMSARIGIIAHDPV